MGFQTINVDRSEGQLLLDMAGVTGAPPPEQWTVELQRRLVSEVDRESLNQGRDTLSHRRSVTRRRRPKRLSSSAGCSSATCCRDQKRICC